MSGITPILDTLLHQVLGRRDAPVDRPLPEDLIAAPRPGQPAQTAHSDSRLDPRPLPASRTAIGGGDKINVDSPTATRAAAGSLPEQGAAAATRFSVAARVIATILARFSASPAVVRAQAPLVLVAARTDVAQLAMRLRDSVATSGLFYEAHLLRWWNGALPLAQLLREPQMLPGGRAAATTQPSPATPTPGNTPTPDAAPPSPTHPALANSVAGDTAGPSTHTAAGMPQAYAPDGKALPNFSAAWGGDPDLRTAQTGGQTPALAGRQDVVHAALEGVVRHQLEMLAAPVFRWEGAPWAGVFMALTLQPPPGDPEARGSPGGHGAREDAETPWQTQITLRLARLGEVKINLQLGAQRIALDLEAEAAEASDRMNAASGTLRDRLGALGFQNVALRIHARDHAGDSHG